MRYRHSILLLALLGIIITLPGCYTKTISRSGGFGPQTGTVHEPDAPDNALEDAADIIYPRDWKQKKPN